MTDSIPDRRDTWLLASVLLVALTVRCGVVGWRFEQLTIDRDAYLAIAENLAAGNGFSMPGTTTPTAYRPPLYPALLAAGIAILPPALAVALLNIVAGVATVWLVSRIGAALNLGSVRHLAAGLIAVDPLLLNATAQPMTEVVFTLLVTAWLWAVTRETASHHVWWSVSAGLFFGLAALCRPTIWPLAGLITGAWMIKQIAGPAPCRSLKQELKRAFVAVAATSVIILPWILRNQFAFGKPILTTTHGGYTLLLANNLVYDDEVVSQPWGTVWAGDSLNRWQADVQQRLQMSLGSESDEPARDAWMSSEARRFIKARPNRFYAAIAHRIRCLWSISPQGEGTLLPSWIRIGVAVFYVAEYFAAIVGLVLIACRRDWPAWLPGLLLIVTIQGVHLVYWTDVRMRTPLEPVLALLAANAFTALRRR